MEAAEKAAALAEKVKATGGDVADGGQETSANSGAGEQQAEAETKLETLNG